jgi:hypothetical protein
MLAGTRGPARRGQVERDPLDLAGEEHHVVEATAGPPGLLRLPGCGAGNRLDRGRGGARQRPQGAIGTPWPCHDSYLYRIRVRSERLVGLTGSVAA